VLSHHPPNGTEDQIKNCQESRIQGLVSLEYEISSANQYSRANFGSYFIVLATVSQGDGYVARNGTVHAKGSVGVRQRFICLCNQRLCSVHRQEQY
jgi:hypothetical protein